jgi:hypothetical protein
VVGAEAWRRIALAALIIVAWAAYFVICSAPAGAPFIYADF